MTQFRNTPPPKSVWARIELPLTMLVVFAAAFTCTLLSL